MRPLHKRPPCTLCRPPVPAGTRREAREFWGEPGSSRSHLHGPESRQPDGFPGSTIPLENPVNEARRPSD